MVTQSAHPSRYKVLLALSVMSWLVFPRTANAQQSSEATDRPQFDVIALRKLADTSPEWGGLRRRAGGLIETPRDTLRELIALAYDMQSGQIEGAPGWSDSVRYDIVRLTGIIALSTGETVLDQTGFRCRVLQCKFDV